MKHETMYEAASAYGNMKLMSERMKRMEMEACMKLWIDTDEAYGHMKHGSG
jgi:hypothetical protein